jgi:signal transduction histidine kinase
VVTRTVAVTVMVLLALLLPLIMALRAFEEGQRENALRDAETAARALAPVIAAVQDIAGAEAAVDLAPGSASGRTWVVYNDGSVVGGSSETAEGSREVADARPFMPDLVGTRSVDVSVAREGSNVAGIRVLLPEQVWHTNGWQIWGFIAGGGLLIVVAAALIADRLARSTVMGIRELQQTAERLSRGDLEARAQVAGPSELTQVGKTLETLAQRVNELMVAERERIADFSHRVRTPLMAVRLGVESLHRGPETQRLAAHVEELEQMVDDAIRQARRATREIVPQATCLTTVVRHRTAFWNVLAEDQQRVMRSELTGDRCPVPMPKEDLEAVVDALVGNVFAHTPEGTDFSISAHIGETCCSLVVEDEGPPLDSLPASRRGVSGNGSTGLGLDIARRAAESTGGRLELSLREGGGLRVEAVFGKVPC